MPQNYSKLLAIGAGIFFGAFLLIQFIRPELRSSPAADISASEPVKHILRTACYNCHSTETRLEWFDRIVPLYWLVVQHVNEGRQILNFSDFNRLPAVEQRAVLFEWVYKIQSGEMPPKSYALLHPESRITPQQLGVLKEYLSAQGQHTPHSH